MKHLTKFSLGGALSGAREWSLRNQGALFKYAVIFMAVLAAARIVYQIWRLVFDPSENGALDLRMFHEWTALWFDNEPLIRYNLLPGTYPVLWPLTGWLSFEAARWLWLVLYIVSITWLTRIVIRESGLVDGREKLFAAIFILAAYPTSITVGNGQMVLLLLPAVLTAVLLGRGGEWSIGREAAVSLLLLFSTLKLTVTAPFFLITLVSQRGYRPAIFTVTGYILLTLFAVHFRDQGIVDNIELWVNDATRLAKGLGGYANVHRWLGAAGAPGLILPSSLALLLALGAWLHFNRRTDIWIALGVAAIIARLWAYHRLYDDLLIIVPVIAIFRILRGGGLSPNGRIAASALLVISWLALLSPGFLLQLKNPLGTLFRTGQVTVWLALLVFLLYCAHTATRKEPDRAGIQSQYIK